MELRHLRYFRAVAEHGGARAAAERLNVAQPAVSRQVHDLEAELGIALFERVGRGMVPTDAGAAYLAEIAPLLDAIEAAGRNARAVAEGRGGRLRIGLLENAAWSGVAPLAIERFARAHPGIRLEIAPLGSREQVERLVAGDLDGGFLYRQGMAGLEAGARLAFVPLRTDDVVLAASAALDFGHDGPLGADDIDGLPMIGFPREVAPDYHDAQRAALAAIGVDAPIVQLAASETAMLALVSAGVGCAIVNSANRGRPPAHVRFHAIEGASVPIEFMFAHRDPPGSLLVPMLDAIAGVLIENTNDNDRASVQ